MKKKSKEATVSGPWNLGMMMYSSSSAMRPDYISEGKKMRMRLHSNANIDSTIIFHMECFCFRCENNKHCELAVCVILQTFLIDCGLW